MLSVVESVGDDIQDDGCGVVGHDDVGVVVDLDSCGGHDDGDGAISRGEHEDGSGGDRGDRGDRDMWWWW